MALAHTSGLGTLFDPTALLHAAGPFAISVLIIIVFIETGLLFPFLPGDSLVFAAGIVSVSLGLSLPVLVLVVALAAAAGGEVGFLIGRRLGGRLFRPDARVFKLRYREQADAFFARYGAPSIVLARFVPIVRTYVPPIVGASKMSLRRFTVWNAIGAVAWALVLSVAGFLLGRIPAVSNNVELIAVAIVVVSVLPIVIGMLRRRIRAARHPIAAEQKEPATPIL
jgi:membrane-associated protein